LGKWGVYSLNGKGQFSIIAALLVAVILIATVIVTYSTIRNSPLQDQPQVLTAIDETNLAIKQILGFTVGYYGSVLQVTGNSSYANMLAVGYLQSGFSNIANMHPEWGTSLSLNKTVLQTYWFTNASYSMGDLAVTYNLTGLGMYGITYETSSRLDVQVLNTTASNQACLNITKDGEAPFVNLGRQNFMFYSYAYSNSTWTMINPSDEPAAFANGTYLISVPSGMVDPYSYMIQVEDPRGMIVVASSFSRYTCSLNWSSISQNATLQNAQVAVELLQNGTMRWLGQDLQVTSLKPIPPIPVKAIHVNQTINSVNQAVPFQIEDWASDYRVPLGLTNNASVFSGRTMLVFLANPNVSKVTIWWNGSDTATQTPLAYTNNYFTVNTDPSQRTLNNGILRLQIDFSDGTFRVTSTMGTSSSTSQFMRINNVVAQYGSSEPMWAIVNGTVRVVVQHEVEWGSGSSQQIPNCPNVYAHIVLTLPANATYYTYQLRFMFLPTDRNRNITDLCPIKLTTTSGTPQTENGTASGYPIVSTTTGLFYNVSSSWAHHWSQFISGTNGAGIMFTDTANQNLYAFDTMQANKTGALRVLNATTRSIELLPINMAMVYLPNATDITWKGAVATFAGTPIYKADKTGLWIIAEYPPTVTVTAES
jgi:hypothetical protein